jgi:hypothetical protein
MSFGASLTKISADSNTMFNICSRNYPHSICFIHINFRYVWFLSIICWLSKRIHLYLLSLPDSLWQDWIVQNFKVSSRNDFGWTQLASFICWFDSSWSCQFQEFGENNHCDCPISHVYIMTRISFLVMGIFHVMSSMYEVHKTNVSSAFYVCLDAWSGWMWRRLVVTRFAYQCESKFWSLAFPRGSANWEWWK